QASHAGEINVAIQKKMISQKDIYGNLGDIIAGKKKGRTSPAELTVFDSTGLAIQDVAVAQKVYQNAQKRNVGRAVKLF
ncbi:MAG: ornithine cyclodeaminase family protein, partial [Candidatus Omnitrophica bacterium]|nr:ornithine cyclodeaminase family protein [Candidatus Omnitrophota bacterium]